MMTYKITSALVGVVLSFGLVALANFQTVAAEVVPGNNGTLKVHEEGTPDKTESNSPKVCSFNLESFGLDEGQTGTIEFDVQGGDGPTGVPAGPFAFGPADSEGYFATQYFDLADGHYKATLYGKDVGSEEGAQTEEKAKSKVFKVDCDTEEEGTPGFAVSLVCPVDKYNLTITNTGETELDVEVNGSPSKLTQTSSTTGQFNVGDTLSVKVNGEFVNVQGKLLNNFKLVTCQGMGSEVTTNNTTNTTTNTTNTATNVVASSGFGAGAATDVASLPVTSGNSAQAAGLIMTISTILAGAGAYLSRSRSGLSI